MPPPHRTGPARAGAAALAVALLAGCAPVDPDAGAGAGAAGAEADPDALVVYSGRPAALVEPLVRDWSAESGTPVRVRYGDSGELAQLLIAEGADTPAGVYLAAGTGSPALLDARGLLATLPDDAAAAVPAGFAAADGSWAGLATRTRGFAYDPGRIAAGELPGTLAGATGRRWRGRVGIAPGDPSFIAMVAALRAREGEAATARRLARLAAADPVRYPSEAAVVAAVAAGEVALGLVDDAAARARPGRGGVRWAPGAPGDPAGFVDATAVAVPAPAAADERAAALVAHLLGAAAQERLAAAHETPLAGGSRGARPPAGAAAPGTGRAEAGELGEAMILIAEAGLADPVGGDGR